MLWCSWYHLGSTSQVPWPSCELGNLTRFNRHAMHLFCTWSVPAKKIVKPFLVWCQMPRTAIWKSTCFHLPHGIQRGLLHRDEREFPFPTIPGNTCLPFLFPKGGNGFFTPIPVLKRWECNFSFLFPSPKVGNAILHSRSFPGNGSMSLGSNYQSWEQDHTSLESTFHIFFKLHR